MKKARKREFLEQMDKVVPWQALIDLIAPYYPEGKKGRPPFSLATIARDAGISASAGMKNGATEGQPGAKWYPNSHMTGLNGPKTQALEVTVRLPLSVASYSDYP